MKQYKYFYKVTDENGQIIFNHRSDYAYRLLALANKESHDSDGNMLAAWYFGKVEHNIPKTCRSAFRFMAIEFETEGTTDDERRGNHQNHGGRARRRPRTGTDAVFNAGRTQRMV